MTNHSNTRRTCNFVTETTDISLSHYSYYEHLKIVLCSSLLLNYVLTTPAVKSYYLIKKYQGDPKPEFICKKIGYYSYIFKLQSPSKYSPFDVMHLLTFFHCSNQFLNSSVLMPFSASAIFCLHLLHMGKMFPFEDFFPPGKQTKKSLLG